jgi:hypothetical protein
MPSGNPALALVSAVQIRSCGSSSSFEAMQMPVSASVTRLGAFSLIGRVARWHIFKPKIPIRVDFGGSYNGKW